MQKIIIKGAKEHNLKNIDIELPREKLIVITGLSGSGKSSLAFDTIFAEGQRRYIESLSSYARQFIGQMEKPNVDSIEGLSPAIAIDQKTVSRNPRSTVGTVTEIYDYLRLLYARIGTPYCPKCGRIISKQTIDEIIEKIILLAKDNPIQAMIIAPVVRGHKGEYHKLFEDFKKSGFVRVIVDNIIYRLDDSIELDKNIKHDIGVVVDRIKIKADETKRISDSLETALELAHGIVLIKTEDREYLFSENYACPNCGIAIEEIEPRIFSFNSPFGACSKCGGLGYLEQIDPDLLVEDKEKSLKQGVFNSCGWSLSSVFTKAYFDALSKKYNFDLDTPFKNLSDEIKNIIFYGTGKEVLNVEYKSMNFMGNLNRTFEGIVNNLQRRYKETSSDYMKSELTKYMSKKACDKCNGARLCEEALSVKIKDLNINQICNFSIRKCLDFFQDLYIEYKNNLVAQPILKEINNRLQFLVDVGLNYLTLSRSANTLSGGEAQRIRLSTQIGSGLTGVLYILDEPSIGLHQRDNDKLINSLRKLRDLQNTLIVVEHDEDTIRNADYLVEIGMGAGENGGNVVDSGYIEEVLKRNISLTAKYLNGEKMIEIPKQKRKGNGKFLNIFGARQNNLKSIDVTIPLGTFTVVTGVSGSGKSSLVNQIIYPFLANKLMHAKKVEGKFDKITGHEFLDKCIDIDQSPIGRTPRSNPCTYLGAFTFIRELFAQTHEAKSRGYSSSRFSFNVKGGRCENCKGDGVVKIEMHFLPDVYIPCNVCNGKRYNKETLNIKFKNKTINDVLNMNVDEACDFFNTIPIVYEKINMLKEVGLGYIKLGHPATKLSGGEAQRVKLAAELCKRSTGKTIYILDEPSTGLHFDDVKKLIGILQRIVDSGNTVLIIEHNLDIIKVADYIIDIGQDGGDNGGQVIAKGTIEEVASNKDSYTGYYLNKLLNK